MATQTMYGSGDGPRLTVAAMVKSPTIIPNIILSMRQQMFFTDQILRSEGSAPSGAFVYYASTPLSTSDSPPIVAEGGEIPLTLGQLGTPLTGRTVKRALGVGITEEMQNRNNYGQVDIQLTQLRNGFGITWNSVFVTAALAAVTGFQTFATAGSWTTSTATNGFIRNDLSKAIQRIRLADADTSNGTGQQKFGFAPDTLIINPVQLTSLYVSPEMQAYWVGNAAERNPVLGDDPYQLLPVNIFGLRTYVTWQMPSGTALVLQSKRVGGYVDERPFFVQPRQYDPNRETYRWNAIRQSGMFIDQPQAIISITGLT